jgi:hypothetical protein
MIQYGTSAKDTYHHQAQASYRPCCVVGSGALQVSIIDLKRRDSQRRIPTQLVWFILGDGLGK